MKVKRYCSLHRCHVPQRSPDLKCALTLTLTLNSSLTLTLTHGRPQESAGRDAPSAKKGAKGGEGVEEQDEVASEQVTESAENVAGLQKPAAVSVAEHAKEASQMVQQVNPLTSHPDTDPNAAIKVSTSKPSHTFVLKRAICVVSHACEGVWLIFHLSTIPVIGCCV